MEIYTALGTSPSVFDTELSYLSVPGSPLSPLTLGQLVDEAAGKWGDSECLYDVPMDTRLSFRQLKNQVDWFASGLLESGLKKGDRIGTWGPNSVRWLITFLAAAKIGLINVPLNPFYKAQELLYALNSLSVKFLVLAEPLVVEVDQNFPQILDEAIPELNFSKWDDGSLKVNSTLAPHLRTIVYMGNEPIDGTGYQLWTEVQTMGKEEKALEQMKKAAETVQFDDILTTPFTSGTTGRPKGAMISHQALVNVLYRIGKPLGLSQQDRKCQTLELTHLYGCSIALLPLAFGCSVVIPSPISSSSTDIKILAQEKCTWIHGTPRMYFELLNDPGFDLADLSSLKGVVVGGNAATKQLLTKMTQKFGNSKVKTTYGLTEGNKLTMGRLEDPPELIFTSAGYPIENTEFKIVDAGGRVVPLGATGEICVRSFGMMQGYWEDEQKTKATIDSARWLHTGDTGYFLKSRHLAIVGRLKDMLIRGGDNIYPKEVEDFLYENLQVEELYVFGVSDEHYGEVPAAWILPLPGVTMDTEHVKQVCEGKISFFKIPVYVKFVTSNKDFPRSTIGKAQKYLMRQQYEKELGLNSQQ